MTNLIKAIINVMNDVKNIEKTMNVGTGSSAYKGVSDKDVKQKIGESMAKNGLVLLPIEIKPTLRVERWEEAQTYNGQTQMKQKQQVFTEVETKYLLMHTSGESQVVVGYGHGVDSQDKSAGKATTYALKNALLYCFLVPTGTIEDADNTHSDEHQVPANGKKQPQAQAPAKEEKKEEPKTQLKPMTKELFDAMMSAIKSGKKEQVKERIKLYSIPSEFDEQLKSALK